LRLRRTIQTRSAKPREYLLNTVSTTVQISTRTIGNPGMDVPDLPALGRLARARNIPLIVDSTLTTPELVRPGEHGAALVIHL
jgi:O-acetylhomoserine (thiol)-lyase